MKLSRTKTTKVTVDFCRFLYEENHSIGEWFKKNPMAMLKEKTPIAIMKVQSASCTKKQREVIR